MAIQIVFPDNPNFQSAYTLDGEEYIINIRYNTRDDTWRIDILNSTNERLLTGLRCMPNGFLTQRYNRIGRGLFAGDLVCVDTQRIPNIQTVNRNNFGTGKRYQLWYFTSQEIRQLTRGG